MREMIKVPASSANLGPGFDSIGLAVNLYLNLEYETTEKPESWEVLHDFGEAVPSDEHNLIVSTALSLCPDLAPRKIKVTSDIPLTRGLGSSSSAIVAGLLLANHLGNLGLDEETLLLKATEIEGHPDNVVPALIGGLTVSAYDGNELYYLNLSRPRRSFVAFIPDYSLSTEKARSVLPASYSRADTAQQSSLSNVLIGALQEEDWKLAGRLMEKDLMHEPYRAALVPELLKVREFAKEFGADATYLSGAGPTVMTMIENENAEEFATFLSLKLRKGRSLVLQPDISGGRILKMDPLSNH